MKRIVISKKICIGIVVVIFFILQFRKIYNTTSHNDYIVHKIGIIDTNLKQDVYENLIYADKCFSEEKTHGNDIVNYIRVKGYQEDIYYYSAINAEGNIDSNEILKGLEWMEKNDVNNVNISLSSKFHSREIQEWIETHSHIQVYASYNNKLNSCDYPAMYINVIASGTKKDIIYKDNDVRYCSNKIIVWDKGIHMFNGNSFLSLETLLERCRYE